jgi:hypothetical protein
MFSDYHLRLLRADIAVIPSAANALGESRAIRRMPARPLELATASSGLWTIHPERPHSANGTYIIVDLHLVP